MSLIDKVFNHFHEEQPSSDDLGLYVIYDRVAEKSGPVFQSVNDQVAYRSYVRLIQESPHLNKDEYVLFRIGTFNERTMTIDAIIPKQQVFFKPLNTHKSVSQLMEEK